MAGDFPGGAVAGLKRVARAGRNGWSEAIGQAVDLLLGHSKAAIRLDNPVDKCAEGGGWVLTLGHPGGVAGRLHLVTFLLGRAVLD